MVSPNALRSFYREANFVENDVIIPRITHAIAVHITHTHIGHHLERRHGNIFNVFELINAVSG